MDMIELNGQCDRYGYRRVAALLREAIWWVNDKLVERLWQRDGMNVPCVHQHLLESLAPARGTIGDWGQFYNQKRPHQVLDVKTPSEEFNSAVR